MSARRIDEPPPGWWAAKCDCGHERAYHNAFSGSSCSACGCGSFKQLRDSGAQERAPSAPSPPPVTETRSDEPYSTMLATLTAAAKRHVLSVHGGDDVDEQFRLAAEVEEARATLLAELLALREDAARATEIIQGWLASDGDNGFDAMRHYDAREKAKAFLAARGVPARSGRADGDPK